MIRTMLSYFRRTTQFSLRSIREQDLRAEEIVLERRLAETHRAIETANRQKAAVVDKLSESGSYAEIPSARRQIRAIEREVVQKQRLAAHIDKALEALAGLRMAVSAREVTSSPLLQELSGAQRPAISRELAAISASDEESARNLAELAETVSAYSEAEFSPERSEADRELDERLRAVIDSRDPSLALPLLDIQQTTRQADASGGMLGETEGLNA